MQLRVLQRLQEQGSIDNVYVGGRTPYAACVDRGWVAAKPRGSVDGIVLTLTDQGRAEWQHQTRRAQLAAELGVENSPQLAKLM